MPLLPGESLSITWKAEVILGELQAPPGHW